jgi:hypothetical protein
VSISCPETEAQALQSRITITADSLVINGEEVAAHGGPFNPQHLNGLLCTNININRPFQNPPFPPEAPRFPYGSGSADFPAQIALDFFAQLRPHIKPNVSPQKPILVASKNIPVVVCGNLYEVSYFGISEDLETNYKSNLQGITPQNYNQFLDRIYQALDNSSETPVYPFQFYDRCTRCSYGEAPEEPSIFFQIKPYEQRYFRCVLNPQTFYPVPK